jgi:hypothetical protein
MCPAEQIEAHRGRRNQGMIRFLLRFLGLWILAAAFVWLVIDGTKSIAGNAIYFTQLGKTWYELSPNSLQLLQPAIERNVAVWLWNPVIQTVLEQPTWLVLGVTGSILILLGRKKKPLIGYGRD